MTDFEMTMLCAQAIGHPVYEDGLLAGKLYSNEIGDRYNPLENDGQAMAVVKKLGVTIDPQEDVPPFTWRAVVALNGDWSKQFGAEGRNLNHAIVACVAKMYAASTRTNLSTKEK